MMTFVVSSSTVIAHTFRKLVIESHAVQRWLRYGFAATFAGLAASSHSPRSESKVQPQRNQ
jgi:threonine/homoserine/homoserine lactone efflux protein